METITKVILVIIIASKFLGGGLFKSKNKVGAYDSFIHHNNEVKTINICILPFDNVSNDTNATKKITSNLLTYLAGSGVYEVIDTGRVEKALQDSKVRTISELNADIIKKIGSDLNCNALLLGTITEYGETRIESESFPIIALNLRLIETKNATIIWTFSSTEIDNKSSSLFSSKRALSLSELSQVAAKKISNALYKQKEKIYQVLVPPQEERKEEIVKLENEGVSEEGKKEEVAKEEITKNEGIIKREIAKGEPLKDSSLTNIEVKQLTPSDLKDFLIDITGYNKGEIEQKKVYHNQVEITYSKNSLPISIKLVDYITAEHAKKFLLYYFPENTSEIKTNNGLSTLSRTSNFGYLNLGITVGQIGLFLKGPKKGENEMFYIENVLSQYIQTKILTQPDTERR